MGGSIPPSGSLHLDERQHHPVEGERENAMKNKRGYAGNGNGAHQDVSPMGHATTTKTRKGKRRAQARRQKQRGWSQDRP